MLHRMVKAGMQAQLRKNRVFKANNCRVYASNRRRCYRFPVLVIIKGNHTSIQGLDSLDLKLSPKVHAEVIKVIIECSD